MAKILVDSSVWIDFLRTGRSSEAETLEKLARAGQVCISDIIRVELLSGARNEPEYRALEDHLASLSQLQEPPGFWNQVAWTRFRLARQGLQASLPDTAIAVIARHYGCPILTLDRPLTQIAKILPVKLYKSR